MTATASIFDPKIDMSRLSQEHQLSLLSTQEQEEVLAGLDLSQLAYSIDYRGRPDQIEVVKSQAPITAYSIGRGGGKTFTGAEWVRDRLNRPKPPGIDRLRFAFLARTAADVRDVMVKGDSGVMNVFPPSQKPEYLSSQRLVKFHDGSEALMFSSIEPGQLRGPQFHYGWVDEFAACRHIPDESGLTAWENMQIAVRLGVAPQILATTTPKRTKEVRKLYALAAAGKNVKLVTGASTYDNPHLSTSYKETLVGLFGGTRLEGQELYADLTADVEGALWKSASIEGDRPLYPDAIGRLPMRVVGVDPSVAEHPRDECGIVIAGATNEKDPLKRQAYVLEDYSILGPPSLWADKVVQAAHDFNAPVIAEVNNGGALVKEMIHSIDPTVKVFMVSARQGKALRAEPVTLAYDQHRVHHMMEFPELEDQMTTWEPGVTKDSPDRIDALVYALTGLVVPAAWRTGLGRTTIQRAKGALPSGVYHRR